MTEQCIAVYAGPLWPGERCREQADHQAVDHVDRYGWPAGIGPKDERFEDAHEAHAHHVDSYGRTWLS